MYRIDVLTLFPEAFAGYIGHSIIGRACKQQIADIKLHNIREYSHDKHHTVDDYPYGGGAGMVMKPEPIFEAVEDVLQDSHIRNVPVILLTPQGKLFTQDTASRLSREKALIIICGHYEGVDERVAEHLATEQISIGDFLLSGGESAAMTVIDSVVRLLPGAIGSDKSLVEESHVCGLLEYPQYTRPSEYRGWQVPDILLSGNHQEIALWRHEQSLIRTAKKRPDLLAKAELTEKDHRILEMLGKS